LAENSFRVRSYTETLVGVKVVFSGGGLGRCGVDHAGVIPLERVLQVAGVAAGCILLTAPHVQ